MKPAPGKLIGRNLKTKVLAAAVISAISLTASLSYCETPVSYLKEGKELLDKGKYSESIDKFNKARREQPFMSDYILFFTARAYSGMGAHADSNKKIEELLRYYPEAPVKKRAMALQLKNAVTACRENSRSETPVDSSKPYAPEGICRDAMKYAEQYIADYPEDAETAFMSANFFMEQGRSDSAKKVFRHLYITGNPFSDAAHKQLSPSDITINDMYAKALNYLKASEYKQSETLLRDIQPAADRQLKVEIHKNLGIALFRQKKYKESAEEFSKAGDIYNTARSLYRAGDMDAFNKTLSKMASAEDRRAGLLMLAFASKKRREGKLGDALQTYHSIIKQYPGLAEEALWGIAWAYLRAGDYKAAMAVLTELKDKHTDSIYLYWAARCREHLTAEADISDRDSVEALYRQGGAYKNFYGLLSGVRANKDKTYSADFHRFLSGSRPVYGTGYATVRIKQQDAAFPAQDMPDSILHSLERYSLLLELGMKNDALAELVRASRSAANPNVVLYLSRKLQETGDYKKAISLISRISDNHDFSDKLEPDIKSILYPLAYWPVVSESAKTYNIDPFLLLAVMREESRFDPEAYSVAGAVGLMQIMPHTAGSVASVIGQGISEKTNIQDVRTNITIGAYYLSTLIKDFASLPAALAAYNAGPDKVREWLRQGAYKEHDEFIEDIPYDETRNYVKRVLFAYFSYQRQFIQ